MKCIICHAYVTPGSWDGLSLQCKHLTNFICENGTMGEGESISVKTSLK